MSGADVSGAGSAGGDEDSEGGSSPGGLPLAGLCAGSSGSTAVQGNPPVGTPPPDAQDGGSKKPAQAKTPPQTIDPFGNLTFWVASTALLGHTAPGGAADPAAERNAPAGDGRLSAKDGQSGGVQAQPWRVAPELAFAARLALPQADATPPAPAQNAGSPAGPVPPNTTAGPPAARQEAGSGGVLAKPAMTANAGGHDGNAPASDHDDHSLADSAVQSAGNDLAGHPALAVAAHTPGDGGPRGASHESAPRAEGQQPAPEAPPEPETPAAAKPREIGLRLEAGPDSQVSIQLIERSSGLHVAVRTHDADLAQSLRTNLNDLVGSLKHEGIDADTWTPPAAEMQQQDAGNGGSRSGEETFQGGGGSQQRGQSGRQGGQGHDRRPRWVDSLEEGFPRSFAG